VTRPAPWKRSTAADRRRQRAEFQVIKLAVANSPEALAQRETARIGDRRSKALVKLRRAVSGQGSTSFTPNQLATLKPQELRQLLAYSAARYARLDQGQKDRLRDNLYLILATAPDETYAYVANMEKPPAS
jgi:hypothetical protein